MFYELLRRHSKRVTPDSGFTLMEVLVVVAILLVIGAIAAPIWLGQRRAAVDATLQSDLHNVGKSYFTWFQNNQLTNQKFNDISSMGVHAVYILGPGATLPGKGNGNNRPVWNTNAQLPPMNISEGNVLEVQVRATSHAASWHTAHEDGHFCIRAYNPSSNYDYAGDSINDMGVGSDGFAGNLYYDSALGHVVEVEEIAASIKAGELPSCYWYGEQWIKAEGL